MPQDIGDLSLFPAFWSGNVRGPTQAFSDKPRKARQLIAAAKAAGDPLLIEGTWRTDAPCHTCFEPRAAVARWEGENLTVHVKLCIAPPRVGRWHLQRVNVEDCKPGSARRPGAPTPEADCAGVNLGPNV